MIPTAEEKPVWCNLRIVAVLESVVESSVRVFDVCLQTIPNAIKDEEEHERQCLVDEKQSYDDSEVGMVSRGVAVDGGIHAKEGAGAVLELRAEKGSEMCRRHGGVDEVDEHESRVHVLVEDFLQTSLVVGYPVTRVEVQARVFRAILLLDD